MALTQDQLDRVGRHRLDPRPSYYNATIKGDVTISELFEAFLILLSDEVKDRMIDFLKSTKEDNTDRKDRDELLTLAMENDLEDSQAKVTLLEEEQQEFSDFRNELNIENFEEVSEVGVLLADLQTAMGEQLTFLDRMQHLNTYSLVLKEKFNSGKINEDLLTEMESWISVINRYKATV